MPTHTPPNGRSKRPRTLRPRGAARIIPEGPARSVRDDAGSLIEHPDGWYWVAADGRQQFGPFPSAADARADRDRDADGAPDVGETLQEAEDEIGIASWIDAETGEPAEGLSPPHLEDR